MENKGYLTSRVQREGRIVRKLYKATKDRVREFTGEALKH